MSKVDFREAIMLLLVHGPENHTEAETILRACESSGLSLEEIVLLLKGNVRERIKSWFTEYSGREMFLGPGYYCTEEIEKIISDLTPQGGKEDGHGKQISQKTSGD